MQPNELLPQEYKIVLCKGQMSSVNLGKLPPDQYSYQFFIHDSSCTPGMLTMVARGTDWQTAAQVVKFNDFITKGECNFSTTDSFDSCRIDFLSDRTENVYLYLPVSPLLVQEIDMQPSFLWGLDEKILSRIDELESGNVTGLRGQERKKAPLGQQAVAGMNGKEIEAFINARYFNGFLSLEEGERQLDYVIFHKMFRTDGDKGFRKFKKIVYRKVLKGIYRLFIKNRSRKLYLAKLYCNYVNTGILAENVQ